MFSTHCGCYSWRGLLRFSLLITIVLASFPVLAKAQCATCTFYMHCVACAGFDNQVCCLPDPGCMVVAGSCCNGSCSGPGGCPEDCTGTFKVDARSCPNLPPGSQVDQRTTSGNDISLQISNSVEMPVTITEAHMTGAQQQRLALATVRNSGTSRLIAFQLSWIAKLNNGVSVPSNTRVDYLF